jgi:hypothetical protein
LAERRALFGEHVQSSRSLTKATEKWQLSAHHCRVIIHAAQNLVTADLSSVRHRPITSSDGPCTQATM